jgi:hypothetical protein
MSSTVRPFHWRPIFEVSLSKMAMMSKPRWRKPRYWTSALPIFPAPIIPTRYRRLRPRISRSWSASSGTGYPRPRLPNEPKNDRSFRTCADVVPPREASAPELTVAMPCPSNSSRKRR